MKKIIGAAIGSCVHVAGLHHFLRLAEMEGYRTITFGPAVPVERLVRLIRDEKPDITALSYRLTPEAAAELFADLGSELKKAELEKTRMIFGGTAPVAERAVKSGLFEKVFNGTESVESIRQYLRGTNIRAAKGSLSDTLIGRIEQKYP
ncbi:MAG TPA: cobalamin B12-binding domain-containing protein, partial [Bacteroidales bacterium]|nr:cobalamin B12-binding domain-containing protein [Bacteroidales bacterium]